MRVIRSLMLVVAVMFAAAGLLSLSGCNAMAVEAGLSKVGEQRDNEAAMRHAGFCAMAANAALRRFRAQGEREAFIRLCDTEAAN